MTGPKNIKEPADHSPENYARAKKELIKFMKENDIHVKTLAELSDLSEEEIEEL